MAPTVRRPCSTPASADAHEQTGHGLSFSWPADRGLLPPLFRLDHALMSDGVTATALRDVAIPGSDHVGFVVEPARPAPLSRADPAG